MKNNVLYIGFRCRSWLFAFILLVVSWQGAYADDSFVPCYHMGRIRECTTVPLASPKEDADAKLFQSPPADRARIYIIRSSTMLPKAKSTIYLDGKPVAKLAPLTYTVIDASPGLHRIRAKNNYDAEIELNLDPGKIQFVENKFSSLFFTTKSTLHPIDGDKIQVVLSRLKLVKLDIEVR